VRSASLIALAALLSDGCGSSHVRPASFDATGGVATVHLSDERQSHLITGPLCLSDIRDSEGSTLLDRPIESDDHRPVELNEGDYTLVVTRCSLRCPAISLPSFALSFHARRSRSYRIEVVSLEGTGMGGGFETTVAVIDASTGDRVSTDVQVECDDGRGVY